MNYIIGINSLHPNSSIAIIDDREDIFVLTEEGLQRKWYHADLPVMDFACTNIMCITC